MGLPPRKRPAPRFSHSPFHAPCKDISEKDPADSYRRVAICLPPHTHRGCGRGGGESGRWSMPLLPACFPQLHEIRGAPQRQGQDVGSVGVRGCCVFLHNGQHVDQGARNSCAGRVCHL